LKCQPNPLGGAASYRRPYRDRLLTSRWTTWIAGTSPAMTLFELVFTEFRREKTSTGQPFDKHGHDEA
jgi:hypothetical protein